MDNSPPPKREVFLAGLLAAPFVAIHTARIIIHKATLSITSRSGSVSDTQVPNPVPKIETNQVVVTEANPHFEIADRTHSQKYGQLTVSFYLYSRSKRIRLVGRKEGKVREMTFTPSIASDHGLPFCMESAVAWVRKNGFTDQFQSRHESAVVVNQQAEITSAATSENEAPVQTSPHQKPPTRESGKQKNTTSSHHSKAFYGRVLRMGEITRPAVGDKAAYQIFEIQLESNYGGVLKEFAGEHLQELATSHGVEVGQQIGIQRIGRKQFTVEVNGKIEERTRNEFFLDPLK